MKDKVTTNQIEEVLLKRELESFTARFNSLQSQMNKLLAEYPIPPGVRDAESQKELTKWFNSRFTSFHILRRQDIVQFAATGAYGLPKEMRHALLAKAIPKFMEETAHAHSVMEDVYRQEEEGNHES